MIQPLRYNLKLCEISALWNSIAGYDTMLCSGTPKIEISISRLYTVEIEAFVGCAKRKSDLNGGQKELNSCKVLWLFSRMNMGHPKRQCLGGSRFRAQGFRLLQLRTGIC